MSNKSSQTKKSAPNNFLEALRELGSDLKNEAKIQVKQIVQNDIPESFGVSASHGTLKPNEQVSFSQSKPDRQSDTDRTINQRLLQMREADMGRSKRQEQEVREQIKLIQQEIRSLAKTAGEFAAEVEIATMQATVEPGIYHQHFFMRLRLTISLLKKKVADSRNWLAEFNGRSKKKGHYWANVKKSGTSYMLSSERYMVTSTG